MLTIKSLSEKKCFICGSVDKTADVQFEDRSFKGVLCLAHIYEKLKPEKEVSRAPSAGSVRAS